MYFVDPKGKWYSTQGMSHPDWAHANRDIVGFVGTKDEGIFDNEGRIALDYFKDVGWIRVKSGEGIEVSGFENLGLIKRILREMARDEAPGRSLWVDVGEGSIRVFITPTGRPDFRDLDARVKVVLHGRYG